MIVLQQTKALRAYNELIVCLLDWKLEVEFVETVSTAIFAEQHIAGARELNEKMVQF